MTGKMGKGSIALVCVCMLSACGTVQGESTVSMEPLEAVSVSADADENVFSDSSLVDSTAVSNAAENASVVSNVAEEGEISGNSCSEAVLAAMESGDFSAVPIADLPNCLAIDERDRQILLVIGDDTACTVGLFDRVDGDKGEWKEVLLTEGYVGSQGIGEAFEGSCRTPQGLYHILSAFGNGEDPGSLLPFRKIEDQDYYVSDPNSPFYNKYVSRNETGDFDPSYGEHLIECGDAYKYVLDFDYNSEGTPNAGSCFFIHCNIGRPTEGCITVTEEMMVRLLQSVDENCAVFICDRQNLSEYIQ
ncbi:MAG: hypothetical protein Q4B22_01080 [Eubacteriales bacterium]|nr:hypothetical protein [Eubacteriales bacterium]